MNKQPTINTCRYCRPNSNTLPSAPCQRKKSSAINHKITATIGASSSKLINPVARIRLALSGWPSPCLIEARAPVPTPTSIPIPRMVPITGQATLMPANPSAPT
ncbi:Uncharacterised protein [Vibrio cholerae]|nr:Uncharacterised protein [Vibrio cholerae]